MSRSSLRAGIADRIARSSRPAAAVALAGCLAVLVVMVAGAGAATSSRTTVVLGSTATMPDPSCPELPCQAVGSVTGFQVSTDQSSLPFRVRKDGKVTAWTLTLAEPTSKQRSFFNGFFGTPPQARLCDPASGSWHQSAPLQPTQPGLDPRAQPLTSARRSSSAPR